MNKLNAWLHPVIRGTFYDKVWDPETHNMYVAINQGHDLRKALAQTAVTLLGELADPMEIYSLTDITCGSNEGTITRGRNAELRGSYIKIAADMADTGITLRNAATIEKTKLAPANIVINKPSRLMMLVPETLPLGEYELSVTTRYGGAATLLKEPRTALPNMPLIVT